MTILNTITKKDGKNGWIAKTIVPLPGIIEKKDAGMLGEPPAPAQLEIETMKPVFGKGVQSRAKVVYKTEYGFRCAISYGDTYAEGGGDYSRVVQSDPSARCTEKKVKTFHEDSLTHYDAIIADVARYYATEDLFTPPVEA